MLYTPSDDDRPQPPPYVRRRQPLDFITECPGIVFWMAVYLPIGFFLTLVFNSIAPLFICLACGYLVNDAFDH